MKKLLLLIALLAGFFSPSCFADALLFTVKSTPYDGQMARIRPVLTSATHASGVGVSVNTVNQWIGDLRGIPYGFTQVWKTPAETESGSAADCKAKAVALYDRMRARGATNVRLVIGRRTMTSRQTHAWLAWETENGSYVLDPTFNWAACKAAKISKRTYVPLYAYSGAQKFRAADGLIAQN
ncbi:MAG: hypothetical protein ABI871_00220 [Chthoniobacterales bacterium]